MLVFAIVAALATAAATPADPPTTVAPANVKAVKAAKDEDPNQTVCKSQPIPGSRMAGRVCLTRQQWAQNEEASKQLLHDAQSRSDVGQTGPAMGMRVP